MQVEIQSRPFILTKALRSYIERKLKSSLSNCTDHVKRVAIRLSDINGPKGGEDKLCQIQIKMAGTSDIIIKNTKEDMYAAIDHATDRAECAMIRKVGRQRRFVKHNKRLEVLAEDPLMG
jgi:putative sigma-54 modulation protein